MVYAMEITKETLSFRFHVQCEMIDICLLFVCSCVSLFVASKKRNNEEV